MLSQRDSLPVNDPVRLSIGEEFVFEPEDDHAEPLRRALLDGAAITTNLQWDSGAEATGEIDLIDGKFVFRVISFWRPTVC